APGLGRRSNRPQYHGLSPPGTVDGPGGKRHAERRRGRAGFQLSRRRPVAMMEEGAQRSDRKGCAEETPEKAGGGGHFLLVDCFTPSHDCRENSNPVAASSWPA